MAALPRRRRGSADTLLPQLVSTLRDQLDGGRARVVVGLTGAPGSGKSTIAAHLEQMLADAGMLAGSVPMDGFHLSNAVLDALDRHDRKGAPDTFDVDGFLSVLDRVRAGTGQAGRAGSATGGSNTVSGTDTDEDRPRSPGTDAVSGTASDAVGEPRDVLAPVYRRDLHEPVAAGSLVHGRGVVVTEGNYLALDSYGWEAVRERIDVLIMLEVPEDRLIGRLIARHKSFGRLSADAAHWVRAVDVPNARLVAGTAERCDEVWELESGDDVRA